MKIHYNHCGTGFKAVYGKKEIAFISEHGSFTWLIDYSKIPVQVSTRVIMFAAGIAHYYGSPDIVEKAASYCGG